jgi:hypothetical protein
MQSSASTVAKRKMGSAGAGVRGGCSQWRLAQRRKKRKTHTLAACQWNYARSNE